MSIVCCKVTENEIIVASDSITVRGWTQGKGSNSYAKLVTLNELIVGSTGCAQESALFQIFCQTRKPQSPTCLAVLDFIQEFSAWKEKKSGKSEIENSNIIVFEGHAFLVEQYFIEEIKNYEAIGAGMEYALSALYLGHSAEKAVNTACELSILCEKPVITYTMKRDLT